MGPGDRRDGQPLIFGWGAHLTRAQKQRYRERFVIAAGGFVFLLILLVIGVGALQQYVLKPRAAVASVNGQDIQRQWYDKNLAYTQFVAQHDAQDLQTKFQALTANQAANARATATANPQPSASGSPALAASASGTPAPASASSAAAPATSGSPGASEAPAASGSPEAAGTPTLTPTPAPTFNPQESATVAALSEQYAADQAQLQGAEQQTIENLIDVDLMQQNAAKLGISVSPDEVTAQAKKVTDQIGGDAALKDLFNTAHLSQDDFNQIQRDIVLRDKFRAYFAGHPDAAPTASATPVPSPTATSAPVEGPQPPTPTATPTPVPTPGADTLQRWLDEQRSSAKITRASFPLPAE